MNVFNITFLGIIYRHEYIGAAVAAASSQQPAAATADSRLWKMAEQPRMLLSQDYAPEQCAKTGAVSSRGNSRG